MGAYYFLKSNCKGKAFSEYSQAATLFFAFQIRFGFSAATDSTARDHLFSTANDVFTTLNAMIRTVNIADKSYAKNGT